jgi:hypothetical protein
MAGRHRVALLIIGVVLTLQFVVPALFLPASGANRWSWQMYSRNSERPEIVALSVTGEQETITLSDHLYRLRSELRVDSDVLDQLCDRIAGVDHFELTYESTDDVVVHPCND